MMTIIAVKDNLSEKDLYVCGFLAASAGAAIFLCFIFCIGYVLLF